MRYQVRWSNGYWKAFDTQRFQDVDMFDLHKKAEERVAYLNRR